MKRVAIIMLSICLLATPVMAGEAAPQPQLPESMEELWIMYLDLLERVEKLEQTVAKLTGSELLEKSGNREEETETQQETEDVETEAPAEEPVTYRAGTYIAGSTIPAGEYIIYPYNADRAIYVEINTDANGKDTVYNAYTHGNFIATVYEGEFFVIENGYAVAFTGNEEIDMSGGEYVAKVGVHLEPGLYLAQAQEGKKGYYEVNADSRHKSIITNNYFENNAYVTLEEGQYITVDGCELIKQ